MSAIIVTGAGGFVGRRLVERLAARGDTVVGIGRGDAPDGWPAAARWLRADLADTAIGNGPGGADRCRPGTYGGARVIRNFVHDIYGFDPGGRGYGIQAACAGDVEISYNVVRNVQRHGIYFGKNIYRIPGAAEDFSIGATPKVRIVGDGR